MKAVDLATEIRLKSDLDYIDKRAEVVEKKEKRMIVERREVKSYLEPD